MKQVNLSTGEEIDYPESLAGFVSLYHTPACSIWKEYQKHLLAILKHHKDRGNNRCWERDSELYRAVGLDPGDPQRPPLEEHRQKCDEYRAGLFEVPLEGEPVAQLKKLIYPGLVNDHTRKLLDLGVKLNPGEEGTVWAEDGMGRDFDGLTEEHLTPGHSIATGHLIGLPEGTYVAEQIRKELGLKEGEGVGAALERILSLKKEIQDLQKELSLAYAEEE